jgi:hypothetical protein
MLNPDTRLKFYFQRGIFRLPAAKLATKIHDALEKAIFFAPFTETIFQFDVTSQHNCTFYYRRRFFRLSAFHWDRSRFFRLSM